MDIPPMPSPDDFRDDSDYLSFTAYSAALASWERVVKHLIEKAHPVVPDQPTQEPQP